ncbi:MAG: YihY/virulence factor BrkB family protein [Dehalococcoidia bacterium]|nr:YihY/virulence factor BrkB family protein [Dehalococcoidia bacterium]
MFSPTRDRFRAMIDRARYRLSPIKERLLRIPAVVLIVRVIHELGEDDASHMAAGVAYYAVLSLFPLVLGLIAILGIFLPAETIQEHLFEFFERNLPGATDVLEQNIEDVIRLRGAIGAISLLLLLWSASTMFGAISRTINRAWDVHKDRPFHIRKLRDLFMAIGVGALFLLSVGATSIFSILQAWDLPFVGIAADSGARVLGFIISLCIFLILYKFIPNTKTYWRYVWPGAVLAAILFEIGKSLFVFYIDRFATYESVYGGVASMIILLIWIYISAFILILGAEISAEYGRMKRGIERGRLITQSGEPQHTNTSGEQSSGDSSDSPAPD